MGRVTVTTWLAAHHGQMSSGAWERRRDEWKPEDSAKAWARNLRERDALPVGDRDGYLVAEDDRGTIVAVACGSVAGTVAEVHALYVAPDQQQRGIGRRLVQGLSEFLAERGATSLRLGVLAANQEARRFYEAIGGRHAGERLFDEEGELLPESVYEWPDITSLLPPPEAGPGR